MSDLSKFSPEERAFIVSIPYRTGIWISNLDDNTGSKIDERQERKSLEATIANLAGKSGKLPFASAVMKSVQQNQSAWPAWENAAGEEKILGDIQKAIKLCKTKVGKAELAQYKQTIWRIGIVVAQAYGEHVDPDNEMHVDRFFQWVGSLTGGAKLGNSPENMSPKEKVALNKLRAILKE